MVRFRVQELLTARGMSVQALADRAKINYKTALGLARGSSIRVDLETLDRVCWALDARPEDVFEYERTKPEGVP